MKICLEQKKCLENWGIFILGSILILTFIVLSIKKVIPTNDPWTTVGFLVGAWIALWYANETYRLRKLSSQQIEAGFQPILNLYVRDGVKTPAEFRIFEYRVLAIRNTGKGVALNLKVQINDKNRKQIPVRWLEQTIISPIKDEIRIMLENKLTNCNDIDGSKIAISAESVNKKSYTYIYTLEKLSDRIVKFEGLENEK